MTQIMIGARRRVFGRMADLEGGGPDDVGIVRMEDGRLFSGRVPMGRTSPARRWALY